MLNARLGRPARSGGALQRTTQGLRPALRSSSRHSSNQVRAYPAYVPEEARDVEELAAQVLLQDMQRVPIKVPGWSQPINTTFAGPQSLDDYPKNAPVVVLLHGFDSSHLEFRRLLPLLSPTLPTYAIDLIGWGFTDVSLFERDRERLITPADKRAHLKAFCEQVIGRPVVIAGASLGAAKAIDFATTHPEWVSKLIILDGQGFIDGIGPMANMPRFLAVGGVKVLRTIPLRQAANKMAYFDKERYATEDAMRIGRLHTYQPGWQDANVAWMRSGGYSISSRISEVEQETLVMWGRNDEILEPSYAQRFMDTLPNGRLVWVEDCGHVPHLEQPAFTAKQIFDFVGVNADVPALVGAAARA